MPTIHIPQGPAINYFQIVRRVIEANIDRLATQRCQPKTDILDTVRTHLVNNSQQWRSNRIPSIAYADPLCRIAYLYGIVPVNANLLEHAFTQEHELAETLGHIQADSGQIKVCAVGGGPGTELLGMAKWLERTHPNGRFNLEFLLVDRVNEWAESWLALKRQVNDRLRRRYRGQQPPFLTVSGNFLAMDAQDVAAIPNYGNIFDQDLFIFSYLISDIFAGLGGLRQFTSAMASQAPTGSKFLFVDRKGPRWEDEVTNLAGAAGVRLGEFQRTTSHMSGDEEASDLGAITRGLADHMPRLTWDAFWVVGTKI